MTIKEPFDPIEFRNALGSFTTGVTVVTTRSDELGDVGLTANSFNSVSLSPPMVLWSLAKSAFSLPAFKTAEYFAVHILSEEQQPVSNQFARRGEDKFSGLALERGPGDIPLLPDCSARFVCKTAYQYEGGDHIIFVGEVLDFSHFPKSPLLFFGGQYGQLHKPAAATSAEGGSSMPDDSLGYLMRVGYLQLIDPLLKELASRGLTATQHYFLASVARDGDKTTAELVRQLSSVDRQVSGNEITDLFERDLVQEVGDKVSLTEAGIQLRIELASVYKSIESDALNALGYEKAQSLKVLLDEFIRTLGKDSE